MAFKPIAVDFGGYDCAEYYPNVVIPGADSWGMDVKDDNVMQAMMRLLLTDDRIKTFTYNDKKKAQLQVMSGPLNRSEEKSEITKEQFTRNGSPFEGVRLGAFFNFFTDADYSDIVAKIKTFQPDFKKMGWTYLEDVSLYLDAGGETLVWQNEKTNGVIVFSSSKKKYQVLHLAASCMPRLFPWAFKDIPLTTEESDLLKLLFEQKDDMFKAKMKAIYDAQDFYSRKLRAAMKDFFKGNFDRAINDQEGNIREIERNIDNYLSHIREQHRRLEEENMRLLVLRNRACSTDESESEIIEFLSSNKSMHLLKRDGSWIYVGVNCYLNDFDEDMFKSYVEKSDKTSSYIYSKSPYDLQTTKNLFLAIWKQRRFKVRVYCEWGIKSSGEVTAVRGSSMRGHGELMKDRLPQPHINEYTCYSGYRETLSNLATSLDYVGIMNTILCSSASINWTDSAVVSYFMDKFFSKKDCKFLEDNDGNLYTVDEVVKILESEKKAA
nr:MAG TPA: hypothetical protein [Bacteriophage sp.]